MWRGRNAQKEEMPEDELAKYHEQQKLAEVKRITTKAQQRHALSPEEYQVKEREARDARRRAREPMRERERERVSEGGESVWVGERGETRDGPFLSFYLSLTLTLPDAIR